MQFRLPLFPSATKLINNSVGVFEKDGIVFYLLAGMPFFSHKKDDMQSFRFITSNLVFQGLCKKVEIRDAFHVTIDYVNRAYKLFEKEGESGFFKPENRHGYCHKLIGDNLLKAQQLLDEGENNCSIARSCGVGESAIRYALNKGYLKKNVPH